MLCQFSFHNFRSYRDETIFDFQAAPFEEFKDSLIRGDKTQEDLLPVDVIYGPNGGGKSNLLRALGCVISLITDPVYDLKKLVQMLLFNRRVSALLTCLMINPRQNPQHSNFFSCWELRISVSNRGFS